MQLRELFEQNNKTAVLAFGRMNPITIGHKKLAETIKNIPGDGYIFLSHKQHSKTDPLNFETKLKFAKECFPGITVGDSSVRTIIEAIKKVNSLGYTNLVFVAGSDRVDEFTKLLNAYNNKEYSFESIDVVNAGARDPDAEGVEGISASKLREAAVNNDVDTFLAGTPSNKFSLEMFNAVRNSMVENTNVKKNDLMSAFEKFFPIAMKVLDIDKLPKIKLEKYLDHLDQPSFGRFANKEVTIYLGVKDRHPIDILRTLAHELVHFKQLLNNELDKDSGNTGSPEENKAHITAGVIMRMFNKKYPEFFKETAVNIDESEFSISYVEPNFDAEWDEATRYPEFIKLGKEGWISLAKKGKSVTIKSAKGINNTDANEPDSFKSLDKDKQKRALSQIKSGKVEMPIVAVYPDGWKELVGGNTRLTGLLTAQGKATVWAFKVPDEILDENFADGKVKGKSRPGRVKRAGASCKGSVTDLRKRAKVGGERGKMYHWCANMKSGKK
jgi:nicotinic acid mononucleotide adenylyltransferase